MENPDTSVGTDTTPQWGDVKPYWPTQSTRLSAYNRKVNYNIVSDGGKCELTVGRLTRGIYLPVQTTTFHDLDMAKEAARLHASGKMPELEELAWSKSDDGTTVAYSHIMKYLLKQVDYPVGQTIKCVVLVYRAGEASMFHMIGERNSTHPTMEEAVEFVRSDYASTMRCLGVAP